MGLLKGDGPVFLSNKRVIVMDPVKIEKEEKFQGPFRLRKRETWDRNTVEE